MVKKFKIRSSGNCLLNPVSKTQLIYEIVSLSSTMSRDIVERIPLVNSLN